jgi:hypothetical protein
MERIENHIDEEMTLGQPRPLLPAYDLRVGDSTAGTVRVHGLFGMRATVRTEDACWTFRRKGFLRNCVSVSREGDDAEIALFRENTWSHSGVLRMPDGRTLRVQVGFFLTKVDVFAEEGSLLVSLRRIWSFMRVSARVRVHPEAATQDLPLLVMMGCCILIMAIRERASRSG